MKGRGRLFLGSYVVLVLVFLLAPVAVIVLFSFNGSPSLAFPIDSLSTQWYSSAIANEKLQTALQNSLIVGAASLVFVAPIGTAAAWAIGRRRVRGGSVLRAALATPLAIPGLFLGTSLLLLFTRIGIAPSLLTVTIAHVLYTLGFYVLVAGERFAGLDPALNEAARTLGASNVQAWRLVTWPLVRPAVIAAMALCFALSLDEFIITFFVVGAENTLPIVIFTSIRTTVTPEINAVASLLLLTSWIAVAVSLLASRRRPAAVEEALA